MYTKLTFGRIALEIPSRLADKSGCPESLQSRAMSHTRRDEKDGRHFRSDRLVVVNGAWFIATREGIDVGPFPSRKRAEAASEELRQVLARIDDPKYACRFVREYESHVMQTGRTPIVVSSGSTPTAKGGLAFRIQSPGTAGITRAPLQVRRWLGE